MLKGYLSYSRRIMLIILLLVIGIGLRPTTLQAQDWLTAYNNSLVLYNNNETTKALAEAERSEQLYRKQYDVNHRSYRSILRQLSILNYDLYQLTQGKQYANREVNSWRKAITVDEATYIGALDILGILYTANNQYDSAIIVLDEALNLATLTPNYNPVEKAIKGCHLAEALYGGGNLQQGYTQFKKSMAVLDPLKEWPTEYFSFCYSFGKTCVAQKDYNRGIKYLSLMLAYYPPEYNNNMEVIDALIDLGKANTELSAYTVGENYFNTAINRLQNTNSDDYIIITKLLADNLERQGRHDESSALLDKLSSSIETGSNQAALLLASQGSILLNQGNALSAIHLFDSALLIIKHNSPIDNVALGNTSYNTAIAYRALGNKEKAIDYYKAAIKSFPDNSVVYQKALIGSARVFLSMGNKNEAMASISSLNLTNKDEWKPTEVGAIYNDLAGYYQSIGDFNKATTYYKEALIAVPVTTSAQLYNNIAFNY